MSKVVTYQTSRGNKISLCNACEAKHKAAGTWPRDWSGEEYASVSHGLHVGCCTECSASEQQIKALRTEAGAAGDDKMVRVCTAALELGEESSEWRECSRVIAEAQG